MSPRRNFPKGRRPKSDDRDIATSNQTIEEHADGDFIVAKKTSIARSGQIVVAIINGEATLKCYVPNSHGIELHPRNPKFPIITVDPTDDFRINGVLLYSFRNYLN